MPASRAMLLAFATACASAAEQASATKTLLPQGATASRLPFTTAVNTADLSAEAVERAMSAAVKLGITAVDFHLGTSVNGAREREGVARAIKSLGRNNLMLITKLDKPSSDITDGEEAAELARTTLSDEFEALEVESVDILMAKDSTSCPVIQAQWAVLEEYLAAGKAKELGVYNFCEAQLDCLLGNATHAPAYNFIMRHVGMGADATGLIAVNNQHGIQTVAYGNLGEPLALPELLTSPTLRQIADAHGRTVEEVALRWNAQSGFAITNRITADYAPDNLPNGSSFCLDPACTPALEAMASVDEWSLTPEEMTTLDELSLDLTYPQSPTYYSTSACPDSFGVSEHPTRSSCNASLPAYATGWC